MTTVEERIREYVEASDDAAFLTSEFLRFGSRPAVGRALRRLTAEKILYRAGYGVYAPTSILATEGPYAGVRVRKFDNSSVVEDFLTKIGVEYRPGLAIREYNEGRSTQIPVVTIVEVGKHRVARKLFSGRVRYERT